MPKAHVNGIDLYYESKGDGEPLFLIQGFAGGHRGWFLQTRAFAKSYRVIVAGNRGIGSKGHTEKGYTIKTLADDMIGLMDFLGIEKAHILGLSMGGIITQEIAIEYPERVMKVVLASTLADADRPYTDEEIELIFRHQRTPRMLEMFGLGEGEFKVDIETVDVMRFFNTVTELGFNKNIYRFIIPFQRIYARRIGAEAITEQLRAVMRCDTFDRLHKIKAPTLVTCGTEDRLISPISSDVIADRVPDSKLVKIEGGSHSVHMEMPRRFNKEVLDFLGDG
jgi:pimeloyl-ACP methyl ester carboxylesterase